MSKSVERLEKLKAQLEEAFADSGCDISMALGEITMLVPRERLLEVAGRLRDDEPFQFNELIDLCGVDYAAYGVSEWITTEASFSGFGRGVTRDQAASLNCEPDKRFAVVYHLLSTVHNTRLRLRVFAGEEDLIVDSVVDIWNCANWFEREAFDLFGILFAGHPDLRRILTDYGFVGHPFRKDFPLGGQVEMRYDAEKQRLVYEPVQLEERVLVPKVIRSDNRYAAEQTEKQDSTDA